ncbi:cytochrome c biogenesis protein, partial [Candidatus Woesearchaeota archaeon]|nr:cytochrome c biogenesis protein [Candidatus Woesearchaeota archaeon]
MKRIIFFLVILFLIFSSVVSAETIVDHSVEGHEEIVDVIYFYGTGCPHCSRLELFLDDIEDKYNLNIVGYEVYQNQTNRELATKLAEEYGDSFRGVPITFIGDKIFVGFSNKIGEQIEGKIKLCIEECCDSPLEKIKLCDVGKATFKKLTLPVVITAAAVDAINPCAFAVLIILLTTILAAKQRRKVITAGLAFSLSIYISYFLMGLGLYSAIQAAGVTHLFYAVVAVLAIFIGLFNLKDYLWYGKWFVMEVPQSWRPKMKMLIKGVTSVPGAFLIGFVVSLFLLPCTSGPYIVILGLLAKATTRNIAMIYLFFYNLIFILPMLIITAVIGFGFATTEEAEEWRQKKLKLLHLIAGVIILLLGIGMLIA